MKQSALRSVFFFQRMVIGLDNYKGKESLSRVEENQNRMENKMRDMEQIQRDLESRVSIAETEINNRRF